MLLNCFPLALGIKEALASVSEPDSNLGFQTVCLCALLLEVHEEEYLWTKFIFEMLSEAK